MGVVAAKKWQKNYARRLFITDVLAIGVAISSSQLLWYGVQAASLQIDVKDIAGFSVGYTSISVVLFAIWVVILDIYSTRDHKQIGSGSTEYKRILDATLRLFGLVAIVMFLLQSQLGRGYFLTALPLGLVLLLASRWLWRQWLVAKRAEGKYLHRSLLVGDRRKTAHLAASILRDGGAGLDMVGSLTKNGTVDDDLIPGVEVLGVYEDVIHFVDKLNVDTVVFTGADDLGPRAQRELGWQLESRHVELIVAPALTDVAGPRIHARPVAGLPLIHVDYPTFEGTKHLAKRGFDIMASGLGLLLLSPLFIAIAIAVRRSSEGPAFFYQERVGLNGGNFRMVKFRSMVVDAEDQLLSLLDQSEGNGILFKMKSDPRVTKIGRFLRRYSLDELPQLINVFKGDMSLVGPRPPLATEVQEYDKWSLRRLLVKPGVTGLWQVSGRSDLSWNDSVRLDLYYVENWSLTGDIVILFRTIKTITAAEGAY